MDRRSVEKLVEEALAGFDHAARAQPKSFLFTRVMAAVKARHSVPNLWTKAAAFISRPGVAICGVLLILFVNISVIVINNDGTNQTMIIQNNSSGKEEFAFNAGEIYDIENADY